MQEFKIFVLLLVSLGCVQAQARAAATSQWKIERISLTPTGEAAGRFTALVSRAATPETISLAADVPFIAVKEYFVAGDRLAVIGTGKNTDGVVVFDLVRQQEIDWFYCYQPQKAWNDSIVYIEWYPNHITERTTDVVLVYDLTKSPVANRLEKNAPQTFPPSRSAKPTRVGLPVYPDSNLKDQSYRNVVDNQDEVRLVLGGPGFLTMPKRRLVFVASEEPGGDASSIQNSLVVIDLSKGITAASVNHVHIPEESFKVKTKTPGFVRVSAMQVASANMVRLSIPKIEYGIGELLVEIPE